LGKPGILIIGRDFDEDGDVDILYGVAHDYGLYWLVQSKDKSGRRVWTKELVDDTFPLVHTLLEADLNGDGIDEIIAGTRVYAHEGDPGATDAPCIYSYKFDPEKSKWQKQVIYEGNPAVNAPEDPEKRDALVDFERGTAGAGLYMEAHDMDGDGDIDLVCPGKTGLYWFENLRI
jgi:hypothetical protein